MEALILFVYASRNIQVSVLSWKEGNRENGIKKKSEIRALQTCNSYHFSWNFDWVTLFRDFCKFCTIYSDDMHCCCGQETDCKYSICICKYSICIYGKQKGTVRWMLQFSAFKEFYSELLINQLFMFSYWYFVYLCK